MATLNTERMAVGQIFPQAIPPGMRCVMCINDRAIQARVQTALEGCQGVVIVGTSASWLHCELLIDEYCPEILVVSETLLFASERLSGAWPIVLKVTNSGENSRDEMTIPETLGPDALRRTIWRVQGKVLEQKSLELRQLLSNYLENTATKRYRESFEVLDASAVRLIKAEEVAFISVDGNYALLNTAAGIFKFRETLNNLMDSLDPERFARIHRSAIVNLNVVDRVIQDPEGSVLLLHDGTRLPVGSTFKGFDSVASLRIGQLTPGPRLAMRTISPP